VVRLSPIKKHISNIKKYLRISRAGGLIRRYFVMNAFDGALTIFGVILGAYAAGISDLRLVVSIGIATSIAVGISGVWGAFLTETAERRRELRSLEKSLHRKLKGTEIERAFTATTYLTAAVDGLSPFVAAIFILAPFILAPPGMSVTTIYHTSFVLATSVFFLLGVYLGRISKENLLLSALKLLLAGAICMIVIMLLSP
jgi:predicted membrane protein (TIGR00267 family)